jgi:hypothetical protein
MKRKLQVALALLGSSKVILLGERLAVAHFIGPGPDSVMNSFIPQTQVSHPGSLCGPSLAVELASGGGHKKGVCLPFGR